MEKFAEEQNLDPLRSSTWYHLVNSRKQLNVPKVRITLFLLTGVLRFFLHK